MASKRFYWLKLKESFFQEKAIKKLRRMSNGDTLTIIYIKLLLYSLRGGGTITFDGLGDTIAEELSLALDEQEDDVKELIDFLTKYRLMEKADDGNEYILHEAVENTGSETDSAARMRAFREKSVTL